MEPMNLRGGRSHETLRSRNQQGSDRPFEQSVLQLFPACLRKRLSDTSQLRRGFPFLWADFGRYGIRCERKPYPCPYQGKLWWARGKNPDRRNHLCSCRSEHHYEYWDDGVFLRDINRDSLRNSSHACRFQQDMTGLQSEPSNIFRSYPSQKRYWVGYHKYDDRPEKRVYGNDLCE